MKNQLELLSMIRAMRIIKGYSQEYIAKKLQISQQAYQKMESGHTFLSQSRLKKILTILDINVLLQLSLLYDYFQIKNNSIEAHRELIHKMLFQLVIEECSIQNQNFLLQKLIIELKKQIK